MILHNSITRLPAAARGGVLAIGNFDGVHPGHQTLIAAAREEAGRCGAPLCVMTFEPHPREFFRPEDAPFRLTLLPMKQRLFAAMGVDALIAPVFDTSFSRLSADAFIREVLAEALDVRHVIAGEDFSFGNERAGTADTLKQAAEKGLFGFTRVTPARCLGHDVYSSTRLRAHIRAGEIAEAARLMGRPFEMEAAVIHGDGRGHALGFPTANQSVSRYARLPYGIYAARVHIEGEDLWRPGVCNFGIRPMFEVKDPLLETHIFDFDSDIYGKVMRVQPLHLLRREMKFSDLAALKAQIAQDCAQAKAWLKSQPMQET